MNGKLNLGDVMGSRTLKLTLKKKWFDLMISGVKTEEFRKPSKWIRSRLFEKCPTDPDKDFFAKDIKWIKFTNGYGADKPYFVCEFKGVSKALEGHEFWVDTGVKVDIEKGDYIIHLGKILEKGNI